MSAQENVDELNLQFEDDGFMEECRKEGNVSDNSTVRKRTREEENESHNQNKRNKNPERPVVDSHHDQEYDCKAVIEEFVRPYGIIKQGSRTAPKIDKCIVVLQGGRDHGSRAYLHRSDLYIYGKRMAKAEFIDVLNYKDELYVKLTFNRPGRGAPRGKHAINFQVVKAWIGKAPVNGKESSLPDEGDPERKAFKDYLQAHKLDESSFRSCYEGKQPKKPFYPFTKKKIQSNTCFVSSLLSPVGEGDGSTCGVLEVAEGPLVNMLWGFDQMCLYICGVRIECNDLNRLFLPADKVGSKDATLLTVEATWKQSGEEGMFWDHRVGPGLKKYETDCKMIANLVYIGDRPKAPEKFESPPSVDDVLNNKPLVQWLRSQKMEPQFFHDLLQGSLPPLNNVLQNGMGLNIVKHREVDHYKPLALNTSTQALPPLMPPAPVSPLTAATEQFLASPSKRKGSWPEGWTNETDRARQRGRTNAFERLGPSVSPRHFSPRKRMASPRNHSDRTTRSPCKRASRGTPSPEVTILSPGKKNISPKKKDEKEDGTQKTSNPPMVNLTRGAVGNAAKSTHVTGTLQRVERIINGVLQCVSHDDPKVNTIITDKSDLQMAMFISKTLTTAIIRYNTVPDIPKQPLPSLGMGNIPNANVGVVKPMNMSTFGANGQFVDGQAGYFNNSKAQNFQQLWNMGAKEMDWGMNTLRGGQGGDMLGFKNAASAAGFQIR